MKWFVSSEKSDEKETSWGETTLFLTWGRIWWLVLFAASVFISLILCVQSVHTFSEETRGVQPSSGLYSTWKYLNWYWSFIASGSHSRYFRLSQLRTRVKRKKKETLPVLVRPHPLHHLLQRVHTSINKAVIRQRSSQSQSLMGVFSSNTRKLYRWKHIRTNWPLVHLK